jgi:thiamine pyrophosphate-dependent acetolactate synthase large subunit-like protein
MQRHAVLRSEIAAAVDIAAPPSTVVVCGLGSSSRAWRERGSDRPGYYASDPMGLALPLAAGVALADGSLHVVCLVGDGDLVMGAGALLSVAEAAPTNLHVCLLDNRRYETGGGLARPGAQTADLTAMAAAAGWSALTYEPESDLQIAVAAWLAMVGPALLVVPVAVEPAPYGGPGAWSGVEERVLFELALDALRTGATEIQER